MLAKNDVVSRNAQALRWVICLPWLWWGAAQAETQEPPPPAEPTPACSDPVFLEVEARARDRLNDEERLRLWQEFLANSPTNPCRAEIQQRILQLHAGAAYISERQKQEAWKQEARGGVIDPTQEGYPLFQILTDPAPHLLRVRLVQELVLLTDDASFHSQVEHTILAQNLQIEAAPTKNLGLSVDVPFVAAPHKLDGFGYAIGNTVLGLRGVWGVRFADDTAALILSGGAWWSPGNSSWSKAHRSAQLDTAAYAAAYHYQLYRMGQSDYAAHAEAEIGWNGHFWVLGFSYHELVQADPVYDDPSSPIIRRMLRWDLGWAMRWLAWLTPSMEVNGGVGLAKSGNYLFLYLSPNLRMQWKPFTAALSLSWPLLDAADYARAIMSLEIAMHW